MVIPLSRYVLGLVEGSFTGHHVQSLMASLLSKWLLDLIERCVVLEAQGHMLSQLSRGLLGLVETSMFGFQVHGYMLSQL